MFRVPVGIFIAAVLACGAAAAEDASGRTPILPKLSLVETDNPPALLIAADPGVVSVIDGDTFWLGIFKVRLKGIDTLEAQQTCKRDGKEEQCAEQVRRELEKLLAAGRVTCSVQFDKYGRPAMNRNRYLASCETAGRDVGTAMVRMGWAFADPRHGSEELAEAQRLARSDGIGLHALTVDMPWDYRALQRAATEETPLDCEDAMSRFCRSAPFNRPPPAEVSKPPQLQPALDARPN